MFWLISAFFFFNFSVVGIYVIFLPKILDTLGYSSFEIGVIFASAPLIRFLVPFLFLKYFSLNKRVLNLSLYMIFFSSLSFYVTIKDFYLFLISVSLYGISSSLILPYIETFSLQYLKKEFYGKARLFGSLGFMIAGLVLAKYLDSYITGVHLFVILVVCTVVFSILISQKGTLSHVQKNKKAKKPFRFGKDFALWINIFLMQVSFGAFYNFFTIFESKHGISLETVSYLWSFSIICEVAVFYFQTYFLKYDLRFLIKLSTLITALRWLIIYLYPSSLPFLYLQQSFHAVSFALYHTATLSYLYTLYKDKKLSSQFYYGFGFGLGGFLGSVLFGYLYGENIFLYASLIAAGGYIVMLLNKSLFFSDKT